jgi:tetraacyldisaccharide 4'-kinase
MAGRQLTHADATVQWLWSGRGPAAQAARAWLSPAAAAYTAYMHLRAQAYQRGLLRPQVLGVPTIAVGNLTVGGTGKTPIAGWIADQCARLGVVPGIVLRGYGGDEAAVHAERVPGAIVVQGRDRPAAARRAVTLGAGVVVLDDAFQRLDLTRDLNLLLVSAESIEAPRHALPAGPWREPWRAARRADLVVVTRKRAPVSQSVRAARELERAGIPPDRVALAHLRLKRLTELVTGRPIDAGRLQGARVLAACAIADPESFVQQLRQLGARVQPALWRDHHRFRPADLCALLSAARDVDYVVVTHKDAVKLRAVWPPFAPAALVAHLDVVWEAGGELVRRLLNDLLAIRYPAGDRARPPADGLRDHDQDHRS